MKNMGRPSVKPMMDASAGSATFAVEATTEPSHVYEYRTTAMSDSETMT